MKPQRLHLRIVAQSHHAQETNTAKAKLAKKRKKTGGYKKTPATTVAGVLYRLYQTYRLVFQLSFDKVAVQTSDVADRNVFRAFCFTSTCVCTVTETEFIHL